MTRMRDCDRYRGCLGTGDVRTWLVESHLDEGYKRRGDKSRGAGTSAIAAGVAMLLGVFAIDAAWGQQPSPKIWDVQLGAPVGELPEEEFVDPACGTNGGPPGLPIGTFEQFEKCRAEASGLREVWFRYDDEFEFIARAA